MTRQVRGGGTREDRGGTLGAVKQQAGSTRGVEGRGGEGPAINIERRVRRHVHAPVHGWFAACSPGLEELLAEEVRAIGGQAVTAAPGGVEFRGRLETGYAANLHLRTASRVWLRVASFAARAPEDVFREAREVPWEALLATEVPVLLEATTARSRLFGGGMLGRPLRDAIRRRFRDMGMTAPGLDGSDREPLQRLLAWLEANHLDLSLDSSGDLLHLRGHRLEHGGAPLRETLAAGILLAAGYDGTGALVDPMCGSGTFGVEAAAIARRLPPGRDREFLFLRWPSARTAAFRQMRARSLHASLSHAPAPIVCRDADGAVLEVARRHVERAGVPDDVTLCTADFLREGPPDVAPGWVVMNPPYGLRLEAGRDAVHAFGAIGRRLARSWRGWEFAIVAPSAEAADALSLPIRRRLRLFHGGLHAVVVLGRVGPGPSSLR
mgnify:CR=1 FL=1